MFEFKLPDVGEGIHEAEILRWLVAEGDAVGQDQPLLELQTDKAVTEIPSPRAGRIARIHAPVGRIARVGEVLVVIDTTTDHRPPTTGTVESGEPAAATSRAPRSAPHAAPAESVITSLQSPSASPQTPRPTPNASPSPSAQRILAAPAVRRLALQLGIDLTQVPGSGPVGRVLAEDVRRFAEGTTEDVAGPASAAATLHAAQAESPLPTLPPPPQETVERVPLQGLRRRIAERMEAAWRVPHVTSFEEADASSLVSLRAHLKPEARRRSVGLTYMPLLIKMTVHVLREFPTFNATLDMANGEILVRKYYHIGVATAIPEGLVVPVIRHADRLTILQIATELGRLASGARQRSLPLADMSGSTFTLTNFGSFGGQQGTPIINPPEVAILGLGRIEERAVVVNGHIEARPILPLALSYDHRLIDGAAAAQFLVRFKTLVGNPAALMLDLA